MTGRYLNMAYLTGDPEGGWRERQKQMTDDRPISEEYRIIAKKYVAADAAASLLEQSKSAFLAQQMTAHGDMPVSRSEMMVKASDEWTAYVQSMVRAREQAALLKVQLEYTRMKFMEEQSANATRRTEMKL